MKIEGILKFCFWISLHQGMLSLLCSRIQGYMLSLMNEVDSYVASTVGFVWDTVTTQGKALATSALYLKRTSHN